MTDAWKSVPTERLRVSAYGPARTSALASAQQAALAYFGTLPASVRLCSEVTAATARMVEEVTGCKRESVLGGFEITAEFWVQAQS